MSTSVPENSLSRDIGNYIRYQLRGRRGLIAAAVAVAVPALWIGWPWLVVAGIAPILIALAPCAIMCALGYCAMRTGSNSNQGEASGANLNSGEANCCSKPQPVDDKIATMTARKLADGPADPMATANPSQARLYSADDPNVDQPQATGQSGATAVQEKEKFE
ncbi:hypothetical protein ACFHWW_26070 [Ensifer sp. P24N7]|uniref:hypothetical protein n=1 Tax=Sinorhizobium sp. P24N7 TaxID=3348358 RepID=UPI0035F2B21F